MQLIRGVCIIKLLYEIFFDIANNFQDIYRQMQKISLHIRGGFTVFGPQRIISKFMYLPPLHVCKVSSKSKFSSSQGSLVSVNLEEISESLELSKYLFWNIFCFPLGKQSIFQNKYVTYPLRSGMIIIIHKIFHTKVL